MDPRPQPARRAVDHAGIEQGDGVAHDIKPSW
jgi:hypothetical protein